jgi:predicted RNA-binding protein YlqC (UPF0109 family)
MAESRAAAMGLVEFLAKGIVQNPDAVRVRDAGDRVLELETDPGDRGRVIGRQGRVAKAMRAVLAASRSGAGWRLEIVD